MILYERGGWRVVPETEVRWGYEWPPILDWKNLPNPHQYYGLSDLEMADLNDAVNFIASNTGRIIKVHAHPKTIGVGVLGKDVQETSVDSFWTIPNADAKVYNLEMQSELRSSLEFFQLLLHAAFVKGIMPSSRRTHAPRRPISPSSSVLSASAHKPGLPASLSDHRG